MPEVGVVHQDVYVGPKGAGQAWTLAYRDVDGRTWVRTLQTGPEAHRETQWFDATADAADLPQPITGTLVVASQTPEYVALLASAQQRAADAEKAQNEAETRAADLADWLAALHASHDQYAASQMQALAAADQTLAATQAQQIDELTRVKAEHAKAIDTAQKAMDQALAARIALQAESTARASEVQRLTEALAEQAGRTQSMQQTAEQFEAWLRASEANLAQATKSLNSALQARADAQAQHDATMAALSAQARVQATACQAHTAELAATVTRATTAESQAAALQQGVHDEMAHADDLGARLVTAQAERDALRQQAATDQATYTAAMAERDAHLQALAVELGRHGVLVADLQAKQAEQAKTQTAALDALAATLAARHADEKTTLAAQYAAVLEELQSRVADRDRVLASVLKGQAA